MAQNPPSKRNTRARPDTFKGALDAFIAKRPYCTLLGVFAAGFLYALMRR
jgi:hypothetical protein